MRAFTAKPFGVNLLLHFPAEDQVAICLEERAPVQFPKNRLNGIRIVGETKL